MMFRRFFHAGTLLLLFVTSVFAQGDVPSGGECDSDADCMGMLDCIRTGVFKKRCFPITCAVGAAQAIVDFGFDSDEYINKVMGDSGMTSKTDFLFLGEDGNSKLSQALAVDIPPMEVFNENFTACLNPTAVEPEGRLRGLRKLQLYPEGRTTYGLQWSGAALFSYFGKSTWTTIDNILIPDVNVQLVSNCVGFLAGGDVGLDFLIQIFSKANSFLPDEALETLNSTSKASYTTDPGNTQYVPVFIAGPFGIQVGWFEKQGPSKQTITEITFGPSLGAALGGFSQCYNQATFSN